MKLFGGFHGNRSASDKKQRPMESKEEILLKKDKPAAREENSPEPKPAPAAEPKLDETKVIPAIPNEPKPETEPQRRGLPKDIQISRRIPARTKTVKAQVRQKPASEPNQAQESKPETNSRLQIQKTKAKPQTRRRKPEMK